jgi:geranylgeranyl diphosphate synthase type I
MTGSAAALDQVRDQVGRALTDFLGSQRTLLAAVDEALLPGLDAMADLLAGGKRLRAAFCYWGWRAAGGADCLPGNAAGAGTAAGTGSAAGTGIMAAAAALELLHGSALVHDDVIDGSDTRRGQNSVHRRFAARHAAAGWRGSADAFGTGMAILTGDLLLAWTDGLLRASGLPEAALRRGQPVLDVMRAEMIAGQCLDLLGQAAGTGTVASALKVITYKSAKYTVERPLQLGAALAGAVTDGITATAGTERKVAAACTAYGIPLGVAFQLRDDVLGVFGDPAQTGKPVGGDLREGKRTVLVAIAASRADSRQGAVLRRHLGDPGLDEAAAAEIRAVLAETGALAECEQMIGSGVRQALGALADAPFTAAAKAALAELALTLTDRVG